MSERRTILEGKWDCGDCDTKGILGREKQCPQCGSPREAGKESEFAFDEAGPGVAAEDERGRALAGAGVDWFCASCGTANRGDGKSCRNCQAERDAKAREWRADEGRGATPPAAVPRKRGAAGKIVAGVVAVAALGAFWGSRTHAMRGEVGELHWKHRRVVETFMPGTGEDWRDQIRPRAPRMPVGGAGEDPGAENLRDCQRKYRKTVREACGTENVCRTVSVRRACGTEEHCVTKNLGNGYAERVCNDVTKYCSEPEERCQMETRYCDRRVDGEWCRYDRYAWVAGFDQSLEGGASQPGEAAGTRWPERALGGLDRDRRTAEYTAKVYYGKGDRPGRDGKLVDWKVPDAATFDALKVGSAVELEVRNLGGVAAVRPVGK